MHLALFVQLYIITITMWDVICTFLLRTITADAKEKVNYGSVFFSIEFSLM